MIELIQIIRKKGTPMDTTSKFSKLQIALICVITIAYGTFTHFVIELTDWTWLAFIMPYGESLFAHTKMISYPLLFAGIYAAAVSKNKDYFTRAVVYAYISIIVQTAFFMAYYIFVHSEILIVDIISYVIFMVLSILGILKSDSKIKTSIPVCCILLVILLAFEIVFSYVYPDVWYFTL